jgi:hypothetical protein
MIDAARQTGGLDAILSSLGFATPSLELGADSRAHLGIADIVPSARVSVGDGALRALSVEVACDKVLRDSVERIARALASRSPEFLWLVLAVERDGSGFAIATWRATRGGPHIGAMITEMGNVMDSDAETLCCLASAARTSGDVMRHLQWLDILGRESITRRFFRALSACLSAMSDSLATEVPAEDRHKIALLTTSRLLFLSFLQTKGWLNRDFGFIANGFADCMVNGGSYQRRILEPLFFGTLNTRVSQRSARALSFGHIPFLNGGLFARTAVERIHRGSRFSDEVLGNLFDQVLVRYRFTAREDAAMWSEAAIDPEMLGKVFESLMLPRERKRGGVYYTPQRLVEQVTRLALIDALERRGLPAGHAELLLDAEQVDRVSFPGLLEGVRTLRLLDPACGSGAFLVHALERIARVRMLLGEAGSLSDIRRSVLTESIFGVDVNPTAVWLCELRLWLSTVIDCEERNPLRIAPLPNLDRQIRIGDSLAGTGFTRIANQAEPAHSNSTLRNRYARANGRRKATLGDRLDELERKRALAMLDSALEAARNERRDLIHAARAPGLFSTRLPRPAGTRKQLVGLRATIRELATRRRKIARGEVPAFSYRTHFAEVCDAGGFDVIVGNPPWVRIHNVNPEERAGYRDRFVVARASAWGDGARAAHAASGFAGQADLAALFIERSIDLLSEDGTLGLLLPSKLWRSLAGGGARQLLLSRTRIAAIEDHSDGPEVFDATVYPSIVVAARSSAGSVTRDGVSRVIVQRRDSVREWRCRSGAIPLDASPGSPWLLLPQNARAAFNSITAAGVPLFESALRRPHLGVKTGCNEAFVVNASTNVDGLTRIRAGNLHGAIEASSLRPLVRGETLTRWRLTHGDERIVWTHGQTGPLTDLPPRTRRWLERWRQPLEQRSDSRTGKWWTLFRTEAASNNAFRVVWCDFGRVPRAAVIETGDATVPLNSCYCISCPRSDDAFALCALLNSDVAAAWLAAIAEPARGGYHRYLGWTIARLPVPIEWPHARRILAPLAEAAWHDCPPSQTALRHAVLTAYGLTPAQIEPLLEWTSADD